MATDTQSQHSFETVDIQKAIDIAAPIEIAFEAMLDELGPDAQMMDGRRCPSSSKHGQAGPMMMSYPALNHLQYRFTAQESGTRLTFVHRGMGLISPQPREGMPKGWGHWIDKIRQRAEQKATQRKK